MVKLKIEKICEYCNGVGTILHRKYSVVSDISKYEDSVEKCGDCKGTGRIIEIIEVCSYQEIIEEEIK